MGPSIQSSSQAAGRLVMFNSKFDGGVYMAERNSGYEPIESIYTRVFTRESGYWDESRGNFGGAYLVPLNSSKTYAWSGLPLLAGRWMRIFEWTLWPTIMGFGSSDILPRVDRLFDGGYGLLVQIFFKSKIENPHTTKPDTAYCVEPSPDLSNNAKRARISRIQGIYIEGLSRQEQQPYPWCWETSEGNNCSYTLRDKKKKRSLKPSSNSRESRYRYPYFLFWTPSELWELLWLGDSWNTLLYE